MHIWLSHFGTFFYNEIEKSKFTKNSVKKIKKPSSLQNKQKKRGLNGLNSLVPSASCNFANLQKYKSLEHVSIIAHSFDEGLLMQG